MPHAIQDTTAGGAASSRANPPIFRTFQRLAGTGFDNSHTHYRFRLAQVASTHGIPIVSADFRCSDAGALITYSAHRSWFRMPAMYVQKILAGATPADLAVQQRASFEVLINRRVADALNLKLPQAVLLRATKLVE